MATFHLKVLTVDRCFYDDAVDRIVVRTTQGDVGILPKMCIRDSKKHNVLIEQHSEALCRLVGKNVSAEQDIAHQDEQEHDDDLLQDDQTVGEHGLPPVNNFLTLYIIRVFAEFVNLPRVCFSRLPHRVEQKGRTERMKKIVCLALCFCLLLPSALALPEMGPLNAKSAALYASNGQELYSMNADEPLQPASVTKIMTMLLAMEALERGEVTLDTICLLYTSRCV